MKQFINRIFTSIENVDSDEDRASLMLVFYGISIIGALIALGACFGFIKKIVTLSLGIE